MVSSQEILFKTSLLCGTFIDDENEERISWLAFQSIILVSFRIQVFLYLAHSLYALASLLSLYFFTF